jgi:alpha-2-macroglobulin
MRSSVTGRTWTICLLWALALAGCGESPPPIPATPAAAPAAGETQEFVLLEAGSEEYEGRPALKLRFSQPLAAAQSFDQLLRVTGPGGADQTGGWVLDEENRVLRFPYLQADQTYTVAFKPGLAAADGRSLAALPAREIYSGNLPPAVGFASQGSVLPARDSDGLPVVSVNVPEVDVEFLRVREGSLSQFFASYLQPQQRSYWELEDFTRIADPVYANRFTLQNTPNQRGVNFLPVQSIPELREPGLYFAVMKRPGVFSGQLETTHYYVSDLGLHARVQTGKLWVHAAALSDGQPRASVEMQVRDEKGLVLVEGETDAEGDLTLEYTPKAEHVLVARSGNEIALIPFRQPALDLSEFAIAGRRHTAQDVYAWSGRDLFRPGEPLQVSALLRDHDGRALADAKTPLFATLRQPDGRAVSTLPLQPGELGYYSYQRTLAADAATGRWTLEYRLDPAATEPLGRFAFRIEEFLPERLKLALDSATPTLAPDAPLQLEVDADYLYGAPAAGNRFTAEVFYRNATHPVAALPEYHFGDPTIELPKEPQAAIDTQLGDDGTLSESIALLPDGPEATAPIDVVVAGSVFESGGRAVRRSLTRTIWPANALVGVRPLFDPEDGADANSQAGFEILRSDVDGNLSAAPALELKLIRERRDFHWTWTDGQGWRSDYTQRYETIEETTIALDGKTPTRYRAPVEWGEYRLEIRDPETGLTLRLPFTAGWSWNDDNSGVDARPDKVKLALDKSSYRPGDVLTVKVTAPYEGPGVLLVESDRLLHRIEIEARAGASYEIPVTQDWLRHDVYVTALVFRPAGDDAKTGPGRAVGIVHVPMASSDRRAQVEIKAPELTRPGETVQIALTAPEFAGQQAYAVVEAVDLGIINLTNYPLPDAADYFLAQRGLGIEAWDLYGRVIERLAGERARTIDSTPALP